MRSWAEYSKSCVRRRFLQTFFTKSLLFAAKFRVSELLAAGKIILKSEKLLITASNVCQQPGAGFSRWWSKEHKIDDWFRPRQ